MGGLFSKKKQDDFEGPDYTQEEDVKPRKELPFWMGRNWESRGTIFGLLIDSAGRVAGPTIMLIPMVMHVVYSKDSFMACNSHDHPSLKDDFWLYLCEYLTAFASAFPVLCATALMLVAGRNLLQKRLYYGMLQAGGVVTFSENDPLRDPIIWAILTCYLHVFAYFCLVLYVCSEEGTLKFNDKGVLVMGTKDRELILGFVSLMLLPATLFTAFFYGAYDIESTLLPLSQFVHDAEDVADNAGESGEALADLVIMSDAVCKCVLADNEDELFGSVGDHEEKCKDLYHMYEAHEENYVAADLKSISLWSSFWPGMLLLKPDIDGQMGKPFKTLWFIVIGIFAFIFASMLVFISVHFYEDVARLTEKPERVQVYVHAGVFFIHLVIVCAFTWPFIQSIMWNFKISPLAGKF